MTIWREQGGRGEPAFLMLHGLGATAAVWRGLCDLIDAQGLGRWVAVDLPGHGASARADSYSVGALAAALAPMLEGERPVIVGHSLGAYVGLALASGWFGPVPAAVLGVGPKIAWSEADLAAMRELAGRPARSFPTEADALARYRKVSGLDERIAPGPEALARGVTREGEGFRLAAEPRTALAGGAPFATLVRSARCPVLLARGEHDALVALAELREHGAEAVDLAGRGHNVHVEAPQALLPLLRRLAAAGHPGDAGATGDVVARFNDAINRHDAAAVAALLSDDTVFENTGPAPDGTRIEGKAAVAAFWERWLAANADAHFEAEEVVVAGDRCTVRWTYRKMRDGEAWHLRGVDVFTVTQGKVAAKRSYVKG